MPAKLAPDRNRGLIVACGAIDAEEAASQLMTRLLAQLEPQPRVVVVSTPECEDVDSMLQDVFAGIGVGEMHRHVLQARIGAEDRAMFAQIENAHLVVLLTDHPLRLSTLIGGTPLARCLRRANADGTAVIGCAAGAAVLCEHMLAGGDEGLTPRTGGASLAPGLGLTNRIVIDQGGNASDRLGRLLASLALNPFALGLGIDRATAAAIGPDNVLEVFGAGGVTLIDPSEIADSNVADLAPGAPIRITNLRLHALTGGARYDLDFRRTVD